MKPYAIAAVTLVALALIFHDAISNAILTHEISGDGERVVYVPSPTPQVQKHTKTVALYNGQSFTLRNSEPLKISFDSSLPITLINGACRSGMSTSFSCSGETTDAIFTDLRPRVPMNDATKNIVTITVDR